MNKTEILIEALERIVRLGMTAESKESELELQQWWAHLGKQASQIAVDALKQAKAQ